MQEQVFLQINVLTPDEAAIQAFQLFSQHARLCEGHPTKVPRTQISSGNPQLQKPENAENHLQDIGGISTKCRNLPSNDITMKPIYGCSSKSKRDNAYDI